MTFILIANWKMNLDLGSSEGLAKQLQQLLLVDNPKKVELWLAPSTACIAVVRESTKGSNIRVGAQNVSGESRGSYTGETSVAQITQLGCSFSLFGHSERRRYFHENDEQIATKLAGAQSQEITTVLCVGETLEERRSGKLEETLLRQLNLNSKCINHNILIAYEPVWAIGTGIVATKSDIAEAIELIDGICKKLSDNAVGGYLYGGSVDASNILEIAKIDRISGVLVGTASQSFSGLSAMLNELNRL